MHIFFTKMACGHVVLTNPKQATLVGKGDTAEKRWSLKFTYSHLKKTGTCPNYGRTRDNAKQEDQTCPTAMHAMLGPLRKPLRTAMHHL